MTVGPLSPGDADSVDWPVRCPVDSRWLTHEPACPDCGTPTESLHALNALAARLLSQASAVRDPDLAIDLVQDATALVPSTEAFEVAAADALEAAGRPDLAAARVDAALAMAPRREDLKVRANSLHATPVRSIQPTRPARKSPTSWLLAAGLVLLLVGASIGALIRPSSGFSVALASPPAPTDPAQPSLAPSSAPIPSASPSSQPTSSPQAPQPVRLVRATLDANPELGALGLSVELIDDTLRVSGPVPDTATVALIESLAVATAPSLKIDTNGLVLPTIRHAYVQSGDTMWSIARRAYDDPRRWRDIAAANPRIDPRRLVVGQRIVLPE